jgi:hypothetical protein
VLIGRVVCAGPSCLEIVTPGKGGRPREFCSDACRKAAARRGLKDTRSDKVLMLCAQMRDKRAKIASLLEELAQHEEALWLVMDTIGEG